MNWPSLSRGCRLASNEGVAVCEEDGGDVRGLIGDRQRLGSVWNACGRASRKGYQRMKCEEAESNRKIQIKPWFCVALVQGDVRHKVTRVYFDKYVQQGGIGKFDHDGPMQ
jgi:hypothetical protein